jgi:hypothetical protein
MGDVNSLIANPAVPDFGASMSNAINNASALTKLRQSQDDQETIHAAGQAIAKGDLKTAEDIYNNAGKTDAAELVKQRRMNIEAGKLAAQGDYAGAAKLHLENGYYDVARKMSADQLKDVNGIQERVAQIAQMPGLTKEQWGSALDVIKSHTPPAQQAEIDSFRDFDTGPKLAIAVAGKTQEYNNSLITQRNSDIADVKAGLVQKATMPGPIGPTEAGPPLPGKTEGTVKLNPATMLPDKSTFTPSPEGISTTGAALPEGVSAGKESHAASAEGIRAMQKEFKAKTGKDLPYEVASSALKSGSGVELSPDGEARVKTLEHSLQATREAQLAVKEKAMDPNFLYNKALASGIGKQDAQNLGRVQQVHAVIGHTEMAENLVGGTELDASKLTPDQAAKRKTAEESIGYLKSKLGYNTLVGMVTPESDAPDFVKKLHQTQVMLEGELTRLATMGQGAVAQGVREHVNQVIGDLAASPSIKNYLEATKTIKEMSNVIASQPMIGKPNVDLINPNLRSPGAGAPSAPAPSPASAQAAPGGPSAAPAPQPGGRPAPVTVGTPEEARKLPKGTPFKTPDGREFIR